LVSRLRLLAVLLQPRLHLVDFALLLADDVVGRLLRLLVLAVLQHDLGHFDGAENAVISTGVSRSRLPRTTRSGPNRSPS
jgi:hypothetical protein